VRRGMMGRCEHCACDLPVDVGHCPRCRRPLPAAFPALAPARALPPVAASHA
jgi:hypothetical protein